MGLASWSIEAFFQNLRSDTKKGKTRRAISKKVSYNKYNQFHYLQ